MSATSGWVGLGWVVALVSVTYLQEPLECLFDRGLLGHAETLTDRPIHRSTDRGRAR